MEEDDPSACSEYSVETIDKANELFFIIEEHETPPDLMERFEFMVEKKYAYGMQQYADYLIAPEILVKTPKADRLAQVKKAFELLMMIHNRPSAVRDHDFDATLFRLSPKLHRYRGNVRNREKLKQWSYPKRQETMPRILARLIDSEAKAFISKWESHNFQWCNPKTWEDWQKFYAYKNF